MFSNLINSRGGALSLAAAAIAGFVFLNLGTSALTGVRVDLTQDRLFTLSDGTRNVLASLNRPVTLNLYYSRALGDAAPPFGLHVTRVRDMLKEFASASSGNITIVEREPEPFSEIEDDAVKAGLQGIPLDESGARVYFGLIGKSGDAKGVIPMFQIERDRFLEYDLARMVSKLQNPDPARVGVWTSAPMFGDVSAQMRGQPMVPWAVISQLKNNFAVRQLVLPEQLGDDVDLLLLAHAAQLNDDELYAIDQYLMRGGKALIFVDPFNEGSASRRFTMGAVPESSDLKKLFDAWGVEIAEDKLAADMSIARLVNAGSDQQLIPAPYVTWLQLGKANISGSDLVTSNLNRLNLASAGTISLKEDTPLKGEPLLWTSTQSQIIDVKNVSGQRPDIRGMVERFEASGETQVLAMRLTGTVNSAFPDGPPKPKASEKPVNSGLIKEDTHNSAEGLKTKTLGESPATEIEKLAETKENDKPNLKPHIAVSQEPLNLLVVADSDLLSDGFWVQRRQFFGRQFTTPVANNGDFVLNAVENLSGSSDLIGLRSRGSARRPFTKLEEMQKAAQEQFKAEEQRLIRQLEEVEKKLVALQGSQGKGKEGEPLNALTDEQKAEVENFTDELLTTRKALRQVRHNLRKDIDSLRNRLSLANIALVPLLVTIAAVGLGMGRLNRRKRAVAPRA
ncbi:MAG: Gldg family protein [Pseudomonadota bacterium]|nr:Gldg family protein [Pseudomonadota bacterium]